MEDDPELREFVELAKQAHSEDELNTATLQVSDRYGNEITPAPAKKKLRELKLRAWVKQLFVRHAILGRILSIKKRKK